MSNKRLFLVLATIVLVMSVVSPASAAGIPYQYSTKDNGMLGKWADLFFNSLVTIQTVGAGVYDVTIQDSGSLVTLSAGSPGGSGTVAAGIHGSVSGSVTYRVTGTLKSPLPTSVGPIDYRSVAHPVYVAPFFDNITSRSVTAWHWDYQAKVMKAGVCVTMFWHDNEVSENAYATSGPNAIMGDIVGSVGCPDPKGAEWFNPGDGRVDPQPGDRLAVWCNINEGTIVVFGVGNDSKGFYLTTFKESDVLKKGAAGVFHNLGTTGIVSINEETPNWFWLAWNGGPFHAYGRSSWAKSFMCAFHK